MAHPTHSFGHFVRSIGLTKKLVIAFLLVALIPLTISISLALYNSAASLNKQTYAQLEAVSEIKKAPLKDTLSILKRNYYFWHKVHCYNQQQRNLALRLKNRR